LGGLLPQLQVLEDIFCCKIQMLNSEPELGFESIAAAWVTQVIVAWVVIQHSLHPAAAHSFGELTTFIIY
jgi:hypothetical protein